MSKEIIIITRTTLINTLYVSEEVAGDMSDEDIKETLREDPEAFGRDDDPVFEEADTVISIERVDHNDH